MEQKAKNLSKNSPLFSVHCILLLVVMSVALLSWFGPIQESMVPLDWVHCLNCFLFMLDTLRSNSAFLLLLCHVIIWALVVLNKSSESHDIYYAYFKESESRRKQGVFSEPSSTEKKWVIDEHGDADIIELTEICSVENVPQLEMEGGDCSCCSDQCVEKSMCASSMAVVPYQGDISNEELKKKFDDFIANFHRQMSLQSRQS